MSTKLKVDLKFRVDGREYGTLEEMPEAVREACEKAGAIAADSRSGGITFSRSTKIVVNGQEYASVEAMPAEARGVYQRAMEALAASQGSAVPGAVGGHDGLAVRRAGDRSAARPGRPRPCAPDPVFSTRTLVLTALIAGLALGLYLLFRSMGP